MRDKLVVQVGNSRKNGGRQPAPYIFIDKGITDSEGFLQAISSIYFVAG